MQYYICFFMVGFTALYCQEWIWLHICKCIYGCIYIFSYLEIQKQKCLKYLFPPTEIINNVTYTLVYNDGKEEICSYKDIFKKSQYDFILVTSYHLKDYQCHKIVFDIENLLPHYEAKDFETTNYIWIFINVKIYDNDDINEKEYKINLNDHHYTYYLVDNKINQPVIHYFLYKYYGVNTIHKNMTIKMDIMDQNAQMQCIWFQNKKQPTISFQKEEYEIN
jgi:hypothetical protein